MDINKKFYLKVGDFVVSGSELTIGGVDSITKNSKSLNDITRIEFIMDAKKQSFKFFIKRMDNEDILVDNHFEPLSNEDYEGIIISKIKELTKSLKK